MPRVYAAWCLFGCLNADISGSVKFPSNAEFKKMGQELAKGIREELEKTNFKGMGQQFGEGLRKEFEAAMDMLFDEKIKPLVADIDKLLKARLEQTDKMAKDRLAQLDKMIDRSGWVEVLHLPILKKVGIKVAAGGDDLPILRERKFTHPTLADIFQ